MFSARKSCGRRSGWTLRFRIALETARAARPPAEEAATLILRKPQKLRYELLSENPRLRVPEPSHVRWPARTTRFPRAFAAARFVLTLI